MYVLIDKFYIMLDIKYFNYGCLLMYIVWIIFLYVYFFKICVKVFIFFIVEIIVCFFCYFLKFFEENECELVIKEIEGVNGFFIVI